MITFEIPPKAMEELKNILKADYGPELLDELTDKDLAMLGDIFLHIVAISLDIPLTDEP